MSELTAHRIARTKHQGLAFVLGLIRLAVFAFVHGMAGGGIFLLGLVVNSLGHHHVCSACQNEVSSRSLLCPACHAKLTRQPASKIDLIILALLIATLVGIWIFTASRGY